MKRLRILIHTPFLIFGFIVLAVCKIIAPDKTSEIWEDLIIEEATNILGRKN